MKIVLEANWQGEKEGRARELPDKFSAEMVAWSGGVEREREEGRESPPSPSRWKFNAEWGWVSLSFSLSVVGNSWRPILAEGGRIRGACMDSR